MDYFQEQQAQYARDREARLTWLKNLKPGDSVAMKDTGFRADNFRIGKVDKITAKRTRFDVLFGGVIQEFNADGRARSTGSWRATPSIEPVTDEVLKQNHLVQLQRKFEHLSQDKNGRLRNDLTISQLERIISILEEVHGQESVKT